jgi:nucleotide-binding universal stress UspA family protein
MAIKKILVPLQNLETAEAALKAALTLARRHRAHVEVLHVRQPPNLPAEGYYPVGVVFAPEHFAAFDAALAGQAEKARALVERVARAAGAPRVDAAAHRDDSGATISWRDKPGVLPFDLSAAARVCDLVLFGRPAGEAPLPDQGLVEEALFQSSRPLLVAPAGRLEAAPRRILVGWNGRREAARALTAAMPVFDSAERVRVLSIGAFPSDLEGPERAAELLRLHGVPADAERRELKSAAAEEELIAAARDWRADLIVMGAYSHSRWREIVLGGFTRRLLRQSEFPLLLAH